MSSADSRGIVILVDDEHHVRASGQQTLELEGFQVLPCASANEALEYLGPEWPGIIVTDVKMPGEDGFGLMSRVRELDADLPVVMITGHGDISMAVKAIRNGAYDFLEKPFRSEILVDVVERALEKRRLVMENRALRSELDSRGKAPVIIGKTPSMERLRQAIDNVADTDADVLIIGETGTGKELVARCLHAKSSRSAGHFVALNCGAMPETIIESELFGHEAGAFTNALKRRVGRFEYAGGGTVFLDEIESIPLPLQVKLLRVLQERTVERLGSNESIPVDVRVIAATKTNLQDACARGTFRADLFYRLDVVRIALPPLRERRDDIPLLFQHFLTLASARFQRTPPQFDGAFLRQLMAGTWPGNVRELQNTAERFALGCGEESRPNGAAQKPAATAMTLPEQVECFERTVIAQELERQRGNVKATYEALGLPRKTLYDKMRKYGLNRAEYS